GSVKASNYLSWSDDEIKVKVPSELKPKKVNVTVTNYAGKSEPYEFVVLEGGDVPSSKAWYFAEGHTGDGFQEYLCIGNPTDGGADVGVRFLFQDGSEKEIELKVAAFSRYTVDVNGVVGSGKDVSAVVSSSKPVMVERPLYFDYHGFAKGASDTLGAPAPMKKWYFAEGTTRPGFEEWVTVLNPNPDDAELTFNYMIQGEGSAVKSEIVKAHSRATFKVIDQIGPGKDVSLYLSSSRDVVAERPMYFVYSGLASHSWNGGHCVTGLNSPSREFFFAEGTTRAGFEEWLCLQNPGEGEIRIKCRYILTEGQGETIEKEYLVPPKERLTVSVNNEIGPEKDVSAKLTSSDFFIAERPMYFNYNGLVDGGHCVIGALRVANNWFFAEGYTAAGFQMWLCVENPGDQDSSIKITYYPESGEPIERSHVVKANTRLTISVNQDAGNNLAISTTVISKTPVIVERPMYMNFRELPCGTCVVGTN
ncbi:MAG: DUF5719 family protein, partial [Actinomycetota bacterium]|nr:DUF5719 family protein [Actinomycetota bacterium]